MLCTKSAKANAVASTPPWALYQVETDEGQRNALDVALSECFARFLELLVPNLER